MMLSYKWLINEYATPELKEAYRKGEIIDADIEDLRELFDEIALRNTFINKRGVAEVYLEDISEDIYYALEYNYNRYGYTKEKAGRLLFILDNLKPEALEIWRDEFYDSIDTFDKFLEKAMNEEYVWSLYRTLMEVSIAHRVYYNLIAESTDGAEIIIEAYDKYYYIYGGGNFVEVSEIDREDIIQMISSLKENWNVYDEECC